VLCQKLTITDRECHIRSYLARAEAEPDEALLVPPQEVILDSLRDRILHVLVKRVVVVCDEVDLFDRAVLRLREAMGERAEEPPVEVELARRGKSNLQDIQAGVLRLRQPVQDAWHPVHEG
jgi:hypothetical protein